jgi:hypothetical protein
LQAVFEIDATEQHFENFEFERSLGKFCLQSLGTTEAALFKPLGHDRESRAILIEQFDAVTCFVDEDEDFSGEWIVFELLTYDDGVTSH